MRYYDRILHYLSLLLLTFGIFAILSGYSIPRIFYHLTYSCGNTAFLIDIFSDLKPIIKTLFIVFIAYLFYLFIYFHLDKKFKRLKEWGRLIYRFLLPLALIIGVWVLIQKWLFHIPVNRWLWGKSHLLIVTGFLTTVALLIFAYEFSRNKLRWKRILIWFSVFFILFWLQPDHGTALFLFAAFTVLLFFKANFKHAEKVFYGLLGFPLIVVFVAIANAKLNLRLPEISYTIVRINNWLDPFHDVTGKSFQIAQSIYALHKGGLMGVGYGFGVRKTYLGATVHSDFVMATVGEELGFMFASFLFILTLLLVLRLLHLAYKFSSKFEKYFTFLVAFEIFTMAWVNAGMAANMLPSKGWPYPFVSYAPMVVLFLFIQLGIIQNFVKNRFYEIF
jgi:cell division protein FtsW (lipid II flippase)